MTTATSTIQELANREYQHGFVTDIEADAVPRGLNEDIVRLISAKKNEPDLLLEWRLKAYRHWLTMEEPRWWPNLQHRAHRLPGHHLLLGPEAEEEAQQPRRGRSRSCARPSRSSASRWTSRSG